MGKRILVTGSRDWSDRDTIAEVLLDACNKFKAYHQSEITLVSGGCPTGADAIAEELWKSWGGEVERHPADWDQYGKRAGFIRNSEMVKLGADICVAFIKNHSKGATMTVDLAHKAGLQIVIRREGE